ncbi:MAG: hypothetical protein OHK0056_14460 [Bacteriovoracaceae bacterium]
MSLNSFNANSWLGSTTDQNSRIAASMGINSYNIDQVLEGQFCPTNFLIPGWKGDGLFTPSALEIKKLQEELWSDSLKLLREQHLSFNNTLKTKVFQEFQSFARSRELDLIEFQTLGQFWINLFDDNSKLRTELDQFIEQYCFRSATLYLYKMRLIVALLDIHQELVGHFTLVNALANPSSFFNRIFPKGSSRELHCEALQSNPFSWYRPSAEIVDKFPSLKKSFSKITLSELMKLTSFRPLKKKESKIDFSDSEYSHALSHVSFGLLINSLMVFFPIWNSGMGFQYPRPLKSGRHDILNSRFVGDHLVSLCHSHWLAQEHNLNIKWSEILCPEFSGECFINGTFTRLCHELQFLTFMTLLAQKQGVQAVDLITRAMREKYAKSADVLSEQGNLFQNTEIRPELLFDRIVINNAVLPKKNPHHNLTTLIQKHAQALTPRGYIYVLSNQKLFVPSQKSKVEQILLNLKLEAYFNFEDLRFRGEIPAYLYIFTKRNSHKNTTFLDPFGNVMNVSNNLKESCLSFRWHGQLTHFSRFNLFVEELQNFFKAKSPFSTPIYQKDLGQNLFFEFHQDSIVDGTLLSSQNSVGSPQVTHPNFFKNLTKTCSPLEQFFAIEQIDEDRREEGPNVAVDLLGINLRIDQRFPLILIVNRSQSSMVKIELITPDMYRAKLEEYGKAFYDYFGLVPKSENINVNLLRKFFDSDIGKQIIQLSLNCESTKVRAKLKTVLVPQFVAKNELCSQEVRQFVQLNSPSADEILKLHPRELNSMVEKISTFTEKHKGDMPWTVGGLLCFLEHEISNALASVKMNRGAGVINFDNPMIYVPLTKLFTKPVYPNNQDIFVDFNVVNQKQLWKNLTEVRLNLREGNQFLELISEDETIVSLHAEPVLLQFIKFISSKAFGMPIASLLAKLKVPEAQKLKEIVDNFISIEEHLSKFKKELSSQISRLLQAQIVP